MRETCKLFSRESTKPGELTHRKLNNQILTFLWRIGNQEQARSVADQFASSVVSTRRHLVTLVVAKLRQGELEPRSYRVEMTNGTGNFRNFQNFQRKGQPQEVDRNFRYEFPETFCSILFRTEIAENFGRMERALSLACLPRFVQLNGHAPSIKWYQFCVVR